MLPPSANEIDNNIKSPNNNTSCCISVVTTTRSTTTTQFNRNSVCLSDNKSIQQIGTPGGIAPPKRRSWCGVGAASPNNNSRRYAEIGNWKQNSRNETTFLESQSFMHQGIGETTTRSCASPTRGDEIDGMVNTAITPQPSLTTRLMPFGLSLRATSSADDSLNQSRESLSSENDVDEDGGSADGDSEGGDSTDTGYGAACDIGLVERLIRTHPVWFLPGIQRAGAFHLLQGKEEGNFVVRRSSQPDTMALSVRLPADKGPYIEHYLIQSTMGRLGLETSENRFNDIPTLIAYYSQCCDELPVQLILPRAIREAPTRQQLSSLALLGQEFWRYPMANPRPPDRQGDISSPESENVLLTLNPIMSTFKGTLEGLAKEISPPRVSRPTPPNTLNIISNTMVSRTASPDTTKTPPPPPPRWAKPLKESSAVGSPNYTVTTTVTFSVGGTGNVLERETVTPGLHTSPSHGDITSMREDPSKRLSPEGQCVSTISSQGSIRRPSLIHKFSQSPVTSPSQILSPTSSDNTFSSSHHQHITPTSQILSPTDSVLSPASGPPSTLLSPVTPDTVSPLSVSRASGRHSKRSKPGARKVSKHYQESDILDSPTVYYRSSVGDKISDYEDIWGPDHSTCSSFKPKMSPFASPDLIQHTGNIISLNNNLLSPSGSQPESSSQSSNSPPQENPISSQCELKNRLNLAIPTSRAETPTPTPTAEKPKQGSPFYAEPADAIAQAVIRRQIRNPLNLSQRHSNPSSFRCAEAQILEETTGSFNNLADDQSTVNSSTELISPSSAVITSTSVDNLNKGRPFNLVGNLRKSAKPVQPPMVKQFLANNKDNSWTLDNSWQFIGNDNEDNFGEDSDWSQVFPPLPLISPHTPESPGEKVTVHQVIAHRFPELNLFADDCRMSAYDNVEGRNTRSSAPSEISEPCTVFSEPWTETTYWPQNARVSGVEERRFESRQNSVMASQKRHFREKLNNLIASPDVSTGGLYNINKKTMETGAVGAGIAIRNYALSLAQDKTTTFAQQIENFISCTRESREQNPQVVMRNMRQFMSGMKNYLVKHGERGFEREVEKERSKLKSTEFLNLDTILENVLYRLVVRPLRGHLQTLFVETYTRMGAIQLIGDNINYASLRPLSELGISSSLVLPSESDLEVISQFINRLQDSDSPLDKLENLLAAIATIIHSVRHTDSKQPNILSADDFLPIFVWILVKTRFVAAEIEAEYMWGLLHPSFLTGEGGYYLTSLSSAVHVLKNLKSNDENPDKKSDTSSTEYPPVLKVVVPDERHGSILTKTLPVRPHMTTKQICKIIAHKSRITNPQDYALYRLIDGEETMLADNECPQEVQGEQKLGMLVYKRTDAKIAWPKQQTT